MFVADLSYRDRKRVGFVCHNQMSRRESIFKLFMLTPLAAFPVVTILLNISATLSVSVRLAGLALLKLCQSSQRCEFPKRQPTHLGPRR